MNSVDIDIKPKAIIGEGYVAGSGPRRTAMARLEASTTVVTYNEQALYTKRNPS